MKLKVNVKLNKIILLTISSVAITTLIIGCENFRILKHLMPDEVAKVNVTKKDQVNIQKSSPTDKKFADVSKVPKGKFYYGGSTTFAPLRSKKFLDAIKKAHPQFELIYRHPLGGKNPGSSTGIEMLLRNELSFSQSSRTLEDKEFERAKKRGLKLKDTPIAIDGVAFYVNPELIKLGVKSITLEDLRKIFVGEIQNWNDLGGPNIKIIPFSRDLKAGGTVKFFYEKVLKKQRLGENVRIVINTTECINKVGGTIGGIGYATITEVIDQQKIYPLSLAKDIGSLPISPCATDDCKSVNYKKISDNSYPLARRLFVVIKLDGELDEKAGIAYKNLLLTNEGHKLIKDAGFVPIN